MFRLAIIFFFIAAASNSLGEPVIEGVQGEIQAQGTVIITGSGFGEKETAAPFLWDDPSSVAYDGEVIPTRMGTFDHPQDPSAQYAEADGSSCPASTMYSLNGRVPGRPVYAATGPSGYLRGNNGPQGDYLYLNWWMRSTNINTSGPSGSSLNKILRVWAGPTGESGRITLYPDHVSYPMDLVAGENNSVYAPFYPQEGFWTNIEVWTDASAGSGNQGILKIWRDGQLLVSAEDLDLGPAGSNAPYTWIQTLGMEAGHNTSLENGDNQFGDIYIDNTLARVFLGDEPTWSNTRHREIQVPSQWGPTQIDFQVNTGSFPIGEAAYLYVVDSAGNANPHGFPVMDESPEGPGQPGQPQRVD